MEVTQALRALMKYLVPWVTDVRHVRREPSAWRDERPISVAFARLIRPSNCTPRLSFWPCREGQYAVKRNGADALETADVAYRIDTAAEAHHMLRWISASATKATPATTKRMRTPIGPYRVRLRTSQRCTRSACLVRLVDRARTSMQGNSAIAQ